MWFTLSHGILKEVYYPRVDHACTRDLGFIVTDGASYLSEEKRDSHSVTSQIEPGVPAYRIRNTAIDGRYRIEKEVLTDPWRDVVVQRVRFVPLTGSKSRRCSSPPTSPTRRRTRPPERICAKPRTYGMPAGGMVIGTLIGVLLIVVLVLLIVKLTRS